MVSQDQVNLALDVAMWLVIALCVLGTAMVSARGALAYRRMNQVPTTEASGGSGDTANNPTKEN